MTHLPLQNSLPPTELSTTPSQLEYDLKATLNLSILSPIVIIGATDSISAKAFDFTSLDILSNLGNISSLPGVPLTIFHLCSQNSFQTVLTLRHLYSVITLLYNLLQPFVYM